MLITISIYFTIHACFGASTRAHNVNRWASVGCLFLFDHVESLRSIAIERRRRKVQIASKSNQSRTRCQHHSRLGPTTAQSNLPATFLNWQNDSSFSSLIRSQRCHSRVCFISRHILSLLNYRRLHCSSFWFRLWLRLGLLFLFLWIDWLIEGTRMLINLGRKVLERKKEIFHGSEHYSYESPQFSCEEVVEFSSNLFFMNAVHLTFVFLSFVRFDCLHWKTHLLCRFEIDLIFSAPSHSPWFAIPIDRDANALTQTHTHGMWVWFWLGPGHFLLCSVYTTHVQKRHWNHQKVLQISGLSRNGSRVQSELSIFSRKTTCLFMSLYGTFWSDHRRNRVYGCCFSVRSSLSLLSSPSLSLSLVLSNWIRFLRLFADSTSKSSVKCAFGTSVFHLP